MPTHPISIPSLLNVDMHEWFLAIDLSAQATKFVSPHTKTNELEDRM